MLLKHPRRGNCAYICQGRKQVPKHVVATLGAAADVAESNKKNSLGQQAGSMRSSQQHECKAAAEAVHLLLWKYAPGCVLVHDT